MSLEIFLLLFYTFYNIIHVLAITIFCNFYMGNSFFLFITLYHCKNLITHKLLRKIMLYNGLNCFLNKALQKNTYKSTVSKQSNEFLVKKVYTIERVLFPSLSSDPDLLLGPSYKAIKGFNGLTLHAMEPELAH